MVKRQQGMGAKRTIKNIITIQFIVTLLAITLSLILVDMKAAYSAGVGGGISIIVTLYFANKVFSAGVGSPAASVARMFYIGEVIKIALTVILFSVAILWLNVSFLPLFFTYVATLLAFWLVLLLN